jgi:hypothetical protein
MHYIPKKKRYDSLSTLYKEMLQDKKVKNISFSGYSIEAKCGRSKFSYGMVDGEIGIRDSKGKDVGRVLCMDSESLVPSKSL